MYVSEGVERNDQAGKQLPPRPHPLKVRGLNRPNSCSGRTLLSRQPAGLAETMIGSSGITRTGSETFISELDDIGLLMQRYRPKLLRYVAFSIGDSDLAESITQDCFLKAYNGRESFRGDCSVNTWLFGIANNLIRDQLRLKKFRFWRKAKATAIDISDVASTMSSHERSPEARLLIQERAMEVNRALDDLSVNQRRVFILKFLEEMDLNEICSVTGMQINTVKTHLHRAITAVRIQLGGNK